MIKCQGVGVALGWVVFATVTGALSTPPSAWAAPKYLTKLKPQVQTLAATSHLQMLGATVVDEIPELRIVLTDQPVQAGFIEYSERNALWTHFDTASPVVPNDPLLNKMGSQLRARLSEAWSRSTGSTQLVVAVVDSGIDLQHADLAANIYTNPHEIPGDGIDNDGNGWVDDVHGWNFAANTAIPQDDHKHGTHVAGILGAVGNNGLGITGVNWNLSILPIKFLASNGSGTTDAAVRGILYAVQQGAKILNNSWGGGPRSQALEDAIRFARDRGVIFVAAAGNDSANNDAAPKYPASYELNNILVVASSEAIGRRSAFSNYGQSAVHIAAPGTDVFSTLPGQAFGPLSGTSMATPVVSGIAALIASVRPDLSMLALKNAVLNAASLPTPSSGWSRIVATDGEVDAARGVSQLEEGFQVWPSRMTVRVGKTHDFTAYNPPAGELAWSVADPTVASINAQGVVQGLKVGETQVRATAGTQRAQTQWIRVIAATGGGSAPGSSCAKSQSTRKLTRAESASQMLGVLLPFLSAWGARRHHRRKRSDRDISPPKPKNDRV